MTPKTTLPTRPQRLLGWWRSTEDLARSEVDTANATAIAGVVGLVVAALQIVYVVTHSPDTQVGSIGWVIAGALITAMIIGGWTLYDRPAPLGIDQLFALALAGMAEASVICALTGGEPERQLIVLWLALAAAISPPSRTLLALAAAYLAGALPLFVHGGAASLLVSDALLWVVLAALVHRLLVGVRRQREAFRNERTTLRELARRDELTGLANRRALQEALDDLENAVQAEKSRAATIAILDIENFKQINDVEGLNAGDRCLRTIALALQRALPPGAGAFRWGGDEFVVLLPGHDLAAARPAILSLSNAISGACRGPDGRPVQTRWGLGELRKEVALEDALEAADLELLEEKGSDAAAQTEPRLSVGHRR
jgi:diguanylate cyclase (GGDEF)-like protein